MRRTEVDVTAEAATGLGAGFASLPSWTLDENQLADLEMLLSGVFAPLTGFMTAADVSAVCESGTLADGFPWPVPVTLDVPEDAVPPAQRRLALNDPEGVPLAVLDISERPGDPVPGAGARPLPAAAAGTGPGAGGVRRGPGARLHHPPPAERPPDRPAAPRGGPAAGPAAAASPGHGHGRCGYDARGAGADRPRRHPAPAARDARRAAGAGLARRQPGA